MADLNNYKSPSEAWLQRAADIEDQYETISVVGLANELGILDSKELMQHQLELARNSNGNEMEEVFEKLKDEERIGVTASWDSFYCFSKRFVDIPAEMTGVLRSLFNILKK